MLFLRSFPLYLIAQFIMVLFQLFSLSILMSKVINFKIPHPLFFPLNKDASTQNGKEYASVETTGI